MPNGLHIDEMSMGYNTWSLSEYGTDRYGVSWPVYFNHDDLADGSGKAGITFSMVEINGRHNMNWGPSNSYGWGGSAMRSYLSNNVYNSLFDELKIYIYAPSGSMA